MEDKSRFRRKGRKRMREKERDKPGARSQAATRQPDTRNSESKIFRKTGKKP